MLTFVERFTWCLAHRQCSANVPGCYGDDDGNSADRGGDGGGDGGDDVDSAHSRESIRLPRRH